MAISTRARLFGDKLRLLRALDLFAGLSAPQLEVVAQTATMTRCAPGDRVLSPADPPERIHILKHGQVRVFRLSADGKQLTLGIYDAGTILGDMHLVGQPRLQETYAEAVDEAVICTLTRDQVRALIRRYPTIGLNIVEHLATRLREAERELQTMAYEPVRQRLARKLLELVERFGVPASEGTLIDARFTQLDLAEMIGTSRETLAHALADLRRSAIVGSEGRQILVRDTGRLAKIAAEHDA